MLRPVSRKLSAAVLVFLPACGLVESCAGPTGLDQSVFDALYSAPAPAAMAPLQVYHLGHSTVGRDVAAMLAELAGAGHGYATQFVAGATLRAHWAPDLAANGMAGDNADAPHRAPRAELESGGYDAVVVTEVVDNRDTVRAQASAEYLAKWAEAAWEANRRARVYLYESWRPLDGEEDWVNRLEADPERLWEGEVLRPALARQAHLIRPIYVIPGGQVLAAFVRRLEEAGRIGPLATADDLFSEDGHLNDYGAYLMALTHYAVLYSRSPVGLPHALLLADGGDAADPGPEAARAMQEVVWEVVTSYPPTGVAEQ